ncbi:MAG: Fis family transcriptional regulator [Sedimentibacter sp.]|nr:Fis family transcriptional regulator [Sedimentibacter sp.]
MDRKIGILANSIELKDIIEGIYKEEVQNGKIIIDILDEDRINEQGLELEKKGVKAIIARSGGYHHTLGKVSVPVVNLKIYTQDILHAVMTAEQLNKKLVLVLSGYDEFDYDEWKSLIHTELIMEEYYTVEEIEGVVSKYKDVNDEIVIIGGGIPCSYAKTFNMDNVNINATEETIRDIVSRAWQIVDNLFNQKYKNNILNNVLDHIHDAVIAVDKNEKIIMFNERAEELFKKNKKNILYNKLKEVFPDLVFITNVLKNKKSIIDEIVHLKNLVVTANVILMEVDGQIEGVLCTFQDITKLQGLEKKIRYEMNKKGLTAKYKFDDIITNNPLMKRTLAKAVNIGMSDSTAMLYGESGTGKEMIAQSIHNISERNREPFVAINCAALTENLLESELFGYEEGAFTGARKGGKPGLFELAHGGTLFLDEINSVTINLQTKLLRVLEEKEVMRIGSDYVIPLDVRILAAANENLKDKIKEGSFRNDLFYRLSILELNIPPLRVRKEDIIPLFKNFLATFAKNNYIIEIDSQLENMLLSYSWPGNVRELRNSAERYVLLGELELEGDKFLDKNSNNIEEKNTTEDKYNNAEERPATDFCLDLKEIDKYVELKVIDMLEKQGMTKNDIAKVLGISRSSLWNKTNSNKDLSKK